MRKKKKGNQKLVPMVLEVVPPRKSLPIFYRFPSDV